VTYKSIANLLHVAADKDVAMQLSICIMTIAQLPADHREPVLVPNLEKSELQWSSNIILGMDDVPYPGL
jgi:hypothetical protein